MNHVQLCNAKLSIYTKICIDKCMHKHMCPFQISKSIHFHVPITNLLKLSIWNVSYIHNIQNSQATNYKRIHEYFDSNGLRRKLRHYQTVVPISYIYYCHYYELHGLRRNITIDNFFIFHLPCSIIHISTPIHNTNEGQKTLYFTQYAHKYNVQTYVVYELYACSERYLTINFFFIPFPQHYQWNTEIGVRNLKHWPKISAHSKCTI